MVHNGILSNYRFLRDGLIGEGHQFDSDTDTEVIPHLLEKHYSECNDVEVALVKTLSMLEGTFALAIISIYHPDQIFCARK